MYRTVIIEDERKLKEALVFLLQLIAPEKINVIGSAEKVSEAVQLIDALKPDVIFMDIQLKDGTGFDVLEHCTYKNFYLIFTTAYQEYALRAFKFSAVDYLLKPIDVEELKNAVLKIEGIKHKIIHHDQIKLLQNSLTKIPERLSLHTQEGIHIIALKDIVRCETSGSYTTFYLADKRRIMVSKPLKHYDEMLELPTFFRIHQSHTINLNYVETFFKEGLVVLKDKTELPVAQRKKEAFLKLIKRR